jgi:uncharacterized protein (TIGR01619 family)
MNGNWEFYPVRVEGKPASIFLDLSLSADAPLKAYPIVAFLRLMLQAPRPDGLAAQEEFEALVAVEDALIPRIVGEEDAVYAGRSTGRGMRDFFFYINDPDRFEREAAAAMASFDAYRFEVGSRDDEQWGVYFDFLFPTPIDTQRILNRQVCDRLRDHGDDLGVARPVDHAVIFTELEPSQVFADWAASEGFTVTQTGEEPDDQDRHVVLFVRDDVPAEIDLVVLPLFEKATELGGIYDGWGCSVPD